MVDSAMIPYRLMGAGVYPAAGENLRCTHVLGDQIEFERADGSRSSIDRAHARRVRVERFREDEEAELCVR